MNSTGRVGHEYFVNTYPFRGITFLRGQGAYLYDTDGQRYLDVMTNYGVNIFGYNHPQITFALREQLEKLPNLHGSFASDVRSYAAEELVRRCRGNLARVYLSNSGAEAIEAALKFTVAASGKRRIVAMEGAYHGKTLGALSVTHGAKYRRDFEPLLWEVVFVPYGDFAALDKAASRQTAAVIVEPIQGEAGVIIPPAGYLRRIRTLCRERQIIFILDEIQTGVGRTGYFLAAHKEKVDADIVCLGKGLAGGIPVGATLVTAAIAERIGKGVHTSTFGGNPLAARGIIETLRLLDQVRLKHITQMGALLVKQLQELKSPVIGAVRGRGLLVGLEVTGGRDQMLKRLQHARVLACPAGDQVVRFLPPYIIGESEVKKVVRAVSEILSE